MVSRPPRPIRGVVAILCCLGSALTASCGAPSVPTGTPPAWSWPFPAEAAECRQIARSFSRENPWDHAHEAVDFACPPGTPVLAVAPGEIVSVMQSEVGGETRWRIGLLLSGEDLLLEYLNLTGVTVADGDRVRAGSALGESALGLHLSVRDETAGKSLDPLIFLPGLAAE